MEQAPQLLPAEVIFELEQQVVDDLTAEGHWFAWGWSAPQPNGRRLPELDAPRVRQLGLEGAADRNEHRLESAVGFDMSAASFTVHVAR
jgi:hypothetical protein